MQDNFNDIFNLTPTDFDRPESKPTSSERYRPDAAAGKDNVYKSVVRFIPWWKSPKDKSIMSKWTIWMTDPVSNESKYVDCPSSIGQKSILQDIYWKLKKSDSVAEQQLADQFSRRQSFASLVQIIKDDNRPELVGKIMVFPYGIKIYNKIMAEIKPEYGKPHIPFDLFEGKPFFINIKKVAGFNNYDDCKFLDEKMPLKIDGEELERTNDGVQKLIEFLKEHSPDLDKYDYQPWTDETTEFVNTVIKNVVPKGKLVGETLKASAQTRTTAKPDADIFDPSKVEIKTIKEEVVETPKPKTNVPTIDEVKSGGSEDDLNFDDLNFDSDGFDEDLYSKL